eukprot:m51a1_g2428 hypothetical protein (523) ;mRNA; f:833392-836976
MRVLLLAAALARLCGAYSVDDYCSGAVPDLRLAEGGVAVYYNPCRNLSHPPLCTRYRLCLFGPGNRSLMLTTLVKSVDTKELMFHDLSGGVCTGGGAPLVRAAMHCDMHNESIEWVDASNSSCNATLSARTSATCLWGTINSHDDYDNRSWWCTEKSNDVVSTELSFGERKFVVYYSPCAPLHYWRAGPVDCSLHRVCAVDVETNTTVLRAGFDYPSSIELTPLSPLTTSANAKQPAASNNKAPRTLTDFGYHYDESGRLRSQSGEPFRFVDQAHYEALGDCVSCELHRRLRADLGLEQTPVSHAGCTEPVPIFVSPNWRSPESGVLVVFVCGSGAVVPGQWARALCINDSLDAGSALPDFAWALERGWAVVALNPNAAAKQAGPGVSEDAAYGHVAAVWEDWVSKSSASRVAIMAHSYGGVLTAKLAEHFGPFFSEKVKAVAMSDSVHGLAEDTAASSAWAGWKEGATRNWAASTAPLDKELPRAGEASCERVSAGHEKHVWTTFSARQSMHAFIETRLKD